jgi:DNA replication protein DnaC
MESKMYETIEQIAYEMRLFGIKAAAARRCQEALASGMHPCELVRLLIEDEKNYRRQMVAKRLSSRAKFRSDCQLEDWDMGQDRGISKAKLKDLGLLNFFHKKENLIIEGKTGVGKTHLAIALGKRICDEGASTRFFSTNLFFEEASAEKTAGKYLLEVIEERYNKGITIVTSQVSPAGWPGLFEDPVIAEAIIDRLKNPSETIKIGGSSYRKKMAPN